MDYPSYKKQAEILNYLLTPATIALAIPLYQQLSLLRKNLLAVICGIISGVFASMSSVLAMSVLFSLSHEDFVTLLPKSITTAIGMGVSEELGGIQTITVAVIIVTGVLGNVIGEGCVQASYELLSYIKRFGSWYSCPCNRYCKSFGNGRN